MQVNVPLLPVEIEIHARRLPPFRTSLLRLMIAVGVAGLFFSLCARLDPLDRAMKYHNRRFMEEMQKSGPASSTARWHSDRAIADRLSHDLLDLFLYLAILTAATLGSIALLGRVLDLLLRRLDTDPDLGPEGIKR